MPCNKKQLLDPIATCCRIILLCFSPPGTKLRVINHKIELTNDSHWEKMVVRPWFQDRRTDLCVLYPVIIRFIEKFVNAKHMSRESINEYAEDARRQVAIDNDMSDSDAMIDALCELPCNLHAPTSHFEKHIDPKCIESIRTLAVYAKKGLLKLGETYGYDNAAFVLQYYANLLDDAITGRYSSELLPKQLTTLTNTSLLNDDGLARLWSNEEIVFICNTFTAWFDAEQTANVVLSTANKASICNMLDTKDTMFLNTVIQSSSA